MWGPLAGVCLIPRELGPHCSLAVAAGSSFGSPSLQEGPRRDHCPERPGLLPGTQARRDEGREEPGNGVGVASPRGKGGLREVARGSVPTGHRAPKQLSSSLHWALWR